MSFVRKVTSETPEVTLATGFRRKYTVCWSSSRFLSVFLSCLRFFSSLVSMWPDAQPPVGSIPQRERMKREGSWRHEEEKSGRNQGGGKKKNDCSASPYIEWCYTRLVTLLQGQAAKKKIPPYCLPLSNCFFCPFGHKPSLLFIVTSTQA